MHSERFPGATRLSALLFLALALAGSQLAKAQTEIISVNPATGSFGVSPSTTVVFTFNAAMDTSLTEVFFEDSNQNPIPALGAWSAGNTVLTYTPVTTFPANQFVLWTATGQDAVGNILAGDTTGGFMTGAGGTSGSGTNAITTFSVGKVHHYQQTSAALPTLDATTPYGFAGVTSLSSNRTATSVTLTMPVTGGVSNLFHLPPPSAELFLLSTYQTNLTSYDATFQPGNYSFFVQAATSNQTVLVNLPTEGTMPQPGAPHVTNYVAAQFVNPNQPFVLGWDAFPGGTATDYVDVDIGTNYGSPNPTAPGALTGTARTFTIPAGTLQAGTVYASQIGFFRFVGSTNSSQATDAYRATYTEFSLVTAPAGPQTLILKNPVWTPSNFSFDVVCTNVPVVIIDYKFNLAAPSWLSIITNGSPGNGFHVVIPQAATNNAIFFRSRVGP